ncbi:hypothetical protein KKF86_01330, partial [bacterium]|nr:hypothetical protein [bacterium]
MKNLLILLVISSYVIGQNIMTPSTMGTAGTIATQSRGDEVIGWNPANLGFEDNPDFSMSFGIIPIVPIPAIRLSNSAVSINWFADYLFSGLYLDDAAKNEMLKVFGDKGWDLNPLLYAKILGISSGNFALTIAAEFNSSITLPPSIINFVMFGNKFDEQISLDAIDGSAQAVIPFSFSYGFPLEIPNLDLDFGNNYFGIGMKLLWGVGFGEIDYFEGGLTTYYDRIVGTGSGRVNYSYDGFGLAFDLGWALQIGDNITTNLAIQNLFGFIKWKDKNSESIEFTLDANMEVSDNLEELIDQLDEMTNGDTTYSIKGFTSDYPTYLVAGLEYDIMPQIQLYFNYRQYFKEEFQFSTTPRFSIATKMNPAKWFPIRLGIALGGYEKFQVGIGFGLHAKHYHFDIGITQTGGVFNSARGVGFSIG